MDVKAVTWKKYYKERGLTYNPQKSGVVEADRRAKEFFKAEAEHAKIQAEYDEIRVSTAEYQEYKEEYQRQEKE